MHLRISITSIFRLAEETVHRVPGSIRPGFHPEKYFICGKG